MPCAIDPQAIQRTIDFHGHECPGLAIGIRAAELALREFGPNRDGSLVAVVETDMCGVDAIQFLTGCTLGKGNLIHRDLGKMAFSFYDRPSGRGLRAILSGNARGEVGAQIAELMRRAASPEPGDARRIAELRTAQQQRYMELPLEDLFDIQPAQTPAPRPAKILQSRTCDACGESAMESRVRLFAGQTLCLPCFHKVEQKI